MAASTLSRERINPQTPLTRGTRAALVSIILVVIPLGLLLYVLPTQTSVYWMWTMRDPRSAMFFAPIYLGSSVYYLLALRENDWQQTLAGWQGVFLVSLLLLIPVALNWDTVRPYHPMTLLWLTVYYAPLFLIPIIWRSQEQRMGPPKRAGPEIAPRWRAWLLGRGVFYFVVVIMGLLFGDAVSARMPWDIGALNLQMFLAQPATFTLPALAMLQGNFLWRRQRLHMAYVFSAGVLQIIALFIAPSPYNWSAPLAVFLPIMFLEWIATPVLMYLQVDKVRAPELEASHAG
jgi:uncharacterized membrane protein